MDQLEPLPSARVMALLAVGVPLTLLCDLLHPGSLRAAHAVELLAGDVALAPAPAVAAVAQQQTA